jgi:hypothetical protein
MPQSGSHQLSSGAIAAIAVSVSVVVIVVIVTLAFCWYQRRRLSTNDSRLSMAPETGFPLGQDVLNDPGAVLEKSSAPLETVLDPDPESSGALRYPDSEAIASGRIASYE